MDTSQTPDPSDVLSSAYSEPLEYRLHVGEVFNVSLPDGRQIEVHSNGVVYANDKYGTNYDHHDFTDEDPNSIVPSSVSLGSCLHTWEHTGEYPAHGGGNELLICKKCHMEGWD